MGDDINVVTESYLHTLVPQHSSQLDRQADSGQDGGTPLGPCSFHSGQESQNTTDSLHGTGLETHI